MSDSDPRLETFLNLATRNLDADPPARDEARDEMLVRVLSAEEAGDAANRLKDRKPGRTWIHAGIAFGALIILGTIAGILIHGTVKEMRSLKNLSEGKLELDEIEIRPESERDFVGARLAEDLPIQLRNVERLVQERPEDPGLFEEYVGLSVQANNTLPPNCRETWQRIDPGNGAWLLRESMMRADRAFKGSGGSGPVTDETAFTEALVLLKQAADAGRFESHAADLRRRRMASLPEPETLADEARAMLLSISTHDISWSRIQQFCGAIIREQSKRLADANDKEGLRELIRVWRELSLHLGTRSSTLLDSVTALGFTIHGKEALLDAATRLGMVEEQDRLNAVDDLGTEASSIFRASPHRKSMSWMAGGSGLASPPPDVAGNPALFTAGRGVEYALVDRLYALGSGVLCLLLLAIAGVEGIRRGMVLNAVADGLAPLFRPADTAWILGLGLLVPVAYYWVITRFTSLGCRDIGAIYYPIPPSALQTLAGLLLIWACLQTLVRWRVVKRISFLGARAGLRIDLATVVLLGLLVAAIGGVRWLGKNEEDYLKAMAAACGLPFLWLVWQAGVVLLAPRAAALPGILCARKLVPPLVLLTGALLASVPLLRGIERDWLRQDTLGRAPRGGGGITMAEELSVRWIAERFEKALAEKP